VASRLGAPRINLVPRGALAGLSAPHRTATVGIRSEHLGLGDGGAQTDAAQARVLRVERLSDQYLVHVQIDGTEQELVSATPTATGLSPGDAVSLQVRRALWFDLAGQRIAV
jgi:multiple sugar transport system ATP-binding protein